ncbi:MAG: pseudaminic acid synthase [Desulfovibrio sp.]
MTVSIQGAGKTHHIGKGHPCFIIAELSANHNHDINRALELIRIAAECGADAVKLQTYTADTMTIDCSGEHFMAKNPLWKDKTLYEVYSEAYTPWEWYPELQKEADKQGVVLFSTPFDHTAVDFLESMNVPCYKVASFEVVDIPLLKAIAATGKPVIMSTGMATLSEIDEAVQTLKDNGTKDLVLLKCTSAYPAPPEEANLRTLPHLAETFHCASGFSDHTLGTALPVAAVALGCTVIEKHMTTSRADGGPDSGFSLEPAEFKEMVTNVRIAEKALGAVTYALTPKQEKSVKSRRSLFVVEDIAQGEQLTPKNIRAIRPGYGLHTRYYEYVTSGKIATIPLKKGTPLSFDLFQG